MLRIFIYHARYHTENFEMASGHLGHLSYGLAWEATNSSTEIRFREIWCYVVLETKN